jgi:hypothetical protein
MSTQPNPVERAYKTLNTATKLTITADEWIMLLAVGLSIAVPHLTGIPAVYGSPAILFLVFSLVAVIKRRSGLGKFILANAFACFVLFLVLWLSDSKLSRFLHFPSRYLITSIP